MERSLRRDPRRFELSGIASVQAQPVVMLTPI